MLDKFDIVNVDEIAFEGRQCKKDCLLAAILFAESLKDLLILKMLNNLFFCLFNPVGILDLEF